MNLNTVNYETIRHLICIYVFLLSLTQRSQRATRALLKKIKKFQEIQDSWIQDKKYNVKKNKISYSENQDKTRNAL